VTVGGPHVIGTIDTIGDQDYHRVQLTAGTAYEIGMYGYTGGPGLLPLADSYLEIYDAAGNLVTSADGGASTPLNTVNSGFDVLFTFTPETSGTYYLNARAFGNIPEGGTDGDLVGDYELFVNPAPADAYKPCYTPDSPLYAIDWGTQVDGSATAATTCCGGATGAR
jgi:serralysin